MVAVNSGPLLYTRDLPSSVQNHLALQRAQIRALAANVENVVEWPAPPAPGPAAPRGAERGLATPIIPLSELERRAIMNALEYTAGDRAVAAHLLGIGRTTLYRKLKEYAVAV